MAARTAIGWAMLACAAAAVVAAGPAAFAQPKPPGGPTFPPLPPLPGSPDAPAADPSPVTDRTRTSFQPPALPDVPSPFEPGPRDPFRRPGPLADVKPEVQLPDGSSVTLPETARQIIRVGPRYGTPNDAVSQTVDKDVTRITYTGGVKVNVTYLSDRADIPPQDVEFAADSVVLWVTGLKLGDSLQGFSTERPKADKDAKDGKEGEKRTTVEAYLAGNVVFQVLTEGAVQGRRTEQVIRAAEVYYDLDRSKAVFLDADLRTDIPTLPGSRPIDPVHLRGREIDRLGQHEYKLYEPYVYSSKRPSDPALTISSAEATLTDQVTTRRNIFGREYRDLRTGKPDVSAERVYTGSQNRVNVLGVPIFAYPKIQTEIDDPLGPLVGLSFRSDRVFGFQTYTTFDAYKLLGVRGPPGNRWVVQADYLSERGLGLGTDFDYRDLFGSGLPNAGTITAYGLSDRGTDQLGGYRGVEPDHPSVRERFVWTHSQDVYEEGSTYLRYFGRLAYLSDKNFYEQFYKSRFDLDTNQETFGYLYGARGNLSGSALLEAKLARPWVTETSWLPKLDAALTGQSLLDDRLVYSSRASAGYAEFRPATQVDTEPTKPSERARVDLLRADWNQRLAAPLDVGPVRITPYGVADVTGYSKDLDGNADGRLYGGAGVTASIPFSKLYADVRDDLFNVRGLNHKVELRADYYSARSNVGEQKLPLLDRLYGDTENYSYDSFRRFAPLYLPGETGLALQSSPLYDPQKYATRRVLDGRPETLDDIDVLRGTVSQRLQTKRGLPGADHTVDWMSLDLSASYFPNRQRDNFGESFAFLEYNYLWNVGDRFSVGSQGWVDPIHLGARYFNVGAFFNRPDGSNAYLGFRYTDPIGSRALIVAFGYQMSPKYSLSLVNVFDFGTNQAQTTVVAFNRTGPDATASIGLTYNAFVNSFGVQFLIVPNAGLVNRSSGVGNLFQ